LITTAFPSPVSQDQLTTYCINFVAELLDRAPNQIDPNAKFTRIGIDSAMSVQLIVSLEELLDTELAPDVIESFPTISSLSAHLAGLAASADKA